MVELEQKPVWELTDIVAHFEVPEVQKKGMASNQKKVEWEMRKSGGKKMDVATEELSKKMEIQYLQTSEYS